MTVFLVGDLVPTRDGRRPLHRPVPACTFRCVLKWPFIAYVEVISRYAAGVAIVLPVLHPAEARSDFSRSTRSIVGIIGLAINYAAVRSGELPLGDSVDPSRPDGGGACAEECRRSPQFARVIVPQAVRVVIPPVTNDFIALFKDTSVCSVILIVELTRKYNELYNSSTVIWWWSSRLVTAGLYC